MRHTIIVNGVYSTPEVFKLGRALARKAKAYYKYLDTTLNVSHDLPLEVSDEYQTMGHIWQQLISSERRGDYLGGTVQMIPHLTGLIKQWIMEYNRTVTVIGGVVGDLENQAALEATRDMMDKHGAHVIMMAPIIYLKSAGEIKTKPVQHSVRHLSGMGIRPTALCLNTDRKLLKGELKKIALFTSVPESCIFENTTTDEININKLSRLTFNQKHI